MTTDRGRLSALTTLMTLQEPGGFTLPAELTDAVAAVAKVSAVPLPELPTYGVEQAASDVLADLAGGRPADVSGYADRLTGVITAGARLDRAQAVVRVAHELAVSSAVNTAADLADQIVTDILRPAFTQLLEQAERLAAILAGHALDTHSLLGAPEVGAAWREMHTVAQRYRQLRQARNLVNTAGLRQAHDDHRGEFADVREPHAVTGHAPGSGRPQPIDYPTDPVELMLWLVGPGKPGKAWLPTTSEQDQRWQDCYGEAQRTRQVAALSARAYAGQNV